MLPLEHIKDFLQTFKSVLSETDVEDTAMEVDNHGLPQLKYFKQLVSFFFFCHQIGDIVLME